MSGLSKDRFVRCGPVSGDLGLYDVVCLIYAVDGMVDTSAEGDLYLEYEVEFFDLQIARANPIPRGYASYNLSSNQTVSTGVATTILFDELVVDQLGGSLASGIYTPGCGAFEVYAEVVLNDTAAESAALQLDLQVNSAALSPPVQSLVYRSSSITDAKIQCVITGFVSLDTDDTILVKATATGAAGTLTLRGDQTRLFLRVLS